MIWTWRKTFDKKAMQDRFVVGILWVKAFPSGDSRLQFDSPPLPDVGFGGVFDTKEEAESRVNFLMGGK